MNDDNDMMRVYRVTMRCIRQGCLHNCIASFIACGAEPRIGSPYGSIKTCLLHDEMGSWRVESFEENPALTAILGRRGEE